MFNTISFHSGLKLSQIQAGTTTLIRCNCCFTNITNCVCGAKIWICLLSAITSTGWDLVSLTYWVYAHQAYLSQAYASWVYIFYARAYFVHAFWVNAYQDPTQPIHTYLVHDTLPMHTEFKHSVFTHWVYSNDLLKKLNSLKFKGENWTKVEGEEAMR